MTHRYRHNVERGIRPSDAEWQDLLADWHNQDPGMTLKVLTRYPTSEGISSYAGLVKAAGHIEGTQCVDLACGDGSLLLALLPHLGPHGHVAAIDMSTAELERARTLVVDPRVSFYEATAQTIPLPNARIDLVFCHLALMLMAPISPVLDEIARVLKPGGRLCAVTIAPMEHEEPTKSIFSWMRSQVFQKMRHADLLNMGDSRFASEDGIRALFSAHPAFMPIEQFELFHLQLEYQVASLWSDLSAFYLPRFLSREEMQDIREAAEAMLKEHVGNKKQITLPFACRRFCVERRH